MGTYTTFSIDGYDLAESKSDVIPEIMAIFRESDRSCARRRLINGNGLGEDEDEWEHVIEYTTTAFRARHRLDVMGFTMQRVRNEYEGYRQREFDGFAEALNEDGGADDEAGLREELRILSRLTFDGYLKEFREIMERGLRRGYRTDGEPTRSALQAHILAPDPYEWGWYQFFGRDPRAFIRAVLSVVADDVTVSQDVTELINGGFYEANSPICDAAVETLLERYPENAPRIVLTEGSDDIRVLRLSLEVLFPHLVGYYTFFDFKSSRAGGGASQLISVVKAFAAAGVANRVIAVLDNDTIGRESQRGLQEVRLPENLAVVSLPQLDWLRRYPTIGPSGNTVLDINGTAASIELYLGADVLMEGDRLMPVQWAGYVKVLGSYQGELQDKNRVQTRWEAKADRCLRDRAQIVEDEWVDLRAIWTSIFTAFDQ